MIERVPPGVCLGALFFVGGGRDGRLTVGWWAEALRCRLGVCVGIGVLRV